jgi:uncharacterized Fe-S cluster-containing protein
MRQITESEYFERRDYGTPTMKEATILQRKKGFIPVCMVRRTKRRFWVTEGRGC